MLARTQSARRRDSGNSGCPVRRVPAVHRGASTSAPSSEVESGHEHRREDDANADRELGRHDQDLQVLLLVMSDSFSAKPAGRYLHPPPISRSAIGPEGQHFRFGLLVALRIFRGRWNLRFGGPWRSSRRSSRVCMRGEERRERLIPRAVPARPRAVFGAAREQHRRSNAVDCELLRRPVAIASVYVRFNDCVLRAAPPGCVMRSAMPAARPPSPRPRKKLSFTMSFVACGRPTLPPRSSGRIHVERRP